MRGEQNIGNDRIMKVHELQFCKKFKPIRYKELIKSKKMQARGAN